MKHNSIVTWILIGLFALFAFSNSDANEALHTEQVSPKAMDTLIKILNNQNMNTPQKY